MATKTIEQGFELVTPAVVLPPEELRENEALFNSEEVRVTPLTDKELAKRRFPVDEIGFPLPIYVPSEYTPDEYNFDDHHHWAPREVMLRNSGELGKTLRHSRTQYVPRELHNNFNRYFSKTPLPKTRIGRIGHLMLSVARYLPREAIDVRRELGTPVRRELTLEERQNMWASNHILVRDIPKIQDVLLKHVAKQQITPDSERTRDEIEEFLRTKDDDIRRELGKKLVRLAAKAAVEPIESIYLDAWETGLLPRQRIDEPLKSKKGMLGTTAMPKEPHLFIARHVLQNKKVQTRTINRLLHNLKSNRVAYA